jgi:hypothetical protein
VTERLKFLTLKKKASSVDRTMKRKQAITILRDYEPELKSVGVISASLFGSVARDDGSPDSDIDVVVRLAESFSKGGLDYLAGWQNSNGGYPSSSAARSM